MNGKGILNTIIDHLPFPLHLRGLKYCGPGTNLKANLANNVQPVNKLDSYCKEHDIFYSKYPDTASRNKADMRLAEQAWQRVTASDSSLGERTAAYAITNIMKAKAKLGMGIKKSNKNGQFPAVKGDAKRASLSRRVHAKRACKKTKKKQTKTRKRNN